MFGVIIDAMEKCKVKKEEELAMKFHPYLPSMTNLIS
jgi:hypothetical protein